MWVAEVLVALSGRVPACVVIGLQNLYYRSVRIFTYFCSKTEEFKEINSVFIDKNQHSEEQWSFYKHSAVLRAVKGEYRR